MKAKTGNRFLQRVIFLLLICALLAGTVAVQAETEIPQFSVTSGTGKAGELVTVQLELKNNPGILNATLTLNYDSALVLTKVERGDALSSLFLTYPGALENGCNFLWDAVDGADTTDGVVLTLTFQLPENGVSGEEYEVGFSYIYGDIADNDLQPITCQMQSGVIELVEYRYGDVNDDGRINGTDVTLVRRHIAGGWNAQIITEAADVNNDGRINGTDVTLIRRYIAGGWGVTLPVAGKCAHSNMAATAAKDSTCTAEGNVAYWYCSACKKYFADSQGKTEIALADTVTPAAGHGILTHNAPKDPTCTDPGHVEYWYCGTCNGYYADAEGKTVLTEVFVTANGHVLGAEASCTEPQRCTVCQAALVEATGHSLTYVAERDPVGANDPGNCAYWQCSVCSKCYLDEGATQEIALADTAWETYLVYFFDLENDTYTVGAYKQSEVLSLKSISPDEMKGYDFNGWHTSENFTEQNKISVIPAGNTQNINLYANRSLHEYKITLLGLGRNESLTYNVRDGIKLTTPTWMKADVGGDCLIFSHWSDENGEKITNIPSGEIGDRTIEANWIYKENYAVSNPDKYTYIGGYQNESGTYSFIYEIGAIKNLVLSVQHYYPFDGISEYSVADAQGYTVGNSQGVEVAQTISQIVSSSTIMAEIEKNTTTHTSGWEIGGKIKPEVEVEGVKASIVEVSGGYSSVDGSSVEKTCFASEDNYEENGVEDELRSTVDYYNETSASRTITEKLIPGVSPVGNYTWARMMNVKVYAIVTYNPYTGENVFDIYSEPTEIYNGLLYTLPNELEYEVSIVSGDVLDFEIPFADIPEMFYTVEYDANGGTGEMPMSVHELGVSSKLFSNTFEKTGYTFVGWKTTADAGAAQYTDAYTIRDIAAAGENVTLYAHWVKNSYTVEYNANTPSNASSVVQNMPGSAVCSYDTAVTLGSEPTLKGWTFDGWYREAVCENRVGGAGEVKANANLSSEVNGTVTLYAKWTANTYTVTFKANGGTGNDKTATYTYDTNAALSANSYTRANYTFLGWSTSSTATTPTYIDKETVKNLVASGNVTLYAIWVKTQASASYTADNNTRDVYLSRGSSHTDTVSTGMSKAALTANGYTSIEITIVFDAQRHFLIQYNKAKVEVVTDSGSLKNKSWETSDFSNNSWTQDKSVTFTIEVSKLNDDGSFKLKWSTVDDGGSANDGWYLGETSVSVTAKK